MKAAVARMAPLMECGVSVVTHAGEAETGDLHLIRASEGRTLLAVVDGSGHGKEAAAAARLAIATVEAHPEEEMAGLVRRCHEQLKGTRGVVMSLACFDGRENRMTWLGVGNIAGVLVRNGLANPEELLTRAGLVGHKLPALTELVTPVAPQDVLIVATDGIRDNFVGEVTPGGGNVEQMAVRIAAEHSKGTDDGLVLVARYRGWLK